MRTYLKHRVLQIVWCVVLEAWLGPSSWKEGRTCPISVLSLLHTSGLRSESLQELLSESELIAVDLPGSQLTSLISLFQSAAEMLLLQHTKADVPEWREGTSFARSSDTGRSRMSRQMWNLCVGPAWTSQPEIQAKPSKVDSLLPWVGHRKDRHPLRNPYLLSF